MEKNICVNLNLLYSRHELTSKFYLNFLKCVVYLSAVILEPLKIKSATVSPSVCHEVLGQDAMILVF